MVCGYGDGVGVGKVYGVHNGRCVPGGDVATYPGTLQRTDTLLSGAGLNVTPRGGRGGGAPPPSPMNCSGSWLSSMSAPLPYWLVWYRYMSSPHHSCVSLVYVGGRLVEVCWRVRNTRSAMVSVVFVLFGVAVTHGR